MVIEERIEKFDKNKDISGDYILYWMQKAQRAEYNHALDFAIDKGNELGKPILVYFGITDEFPDANERHYRFMLEGLRETINSLKDKNIQLVLEHNSPEEGIIEMAEDAALVVMDKGYLDIEKSWRKEVAKEIDCPFFEVETDAVVPVEEASEKEEYAARTIRPKINNQLDKYLKKLNEKSPEKSSLEYSFKSFSLDDLDKAMSKLNIDDDVQKTDYYSGGLSEAKNLLDSFVKKKLSKYPDHSNDPSMDYLSNMSPYLHFGQISPLYIALKISETEKQGKEEYLEQLIIRRELAINFTHYNSDYDSLDCLPDWAKETLKEHRDDEREYTYSLREFEEAKTHDPYWNAAQTEMVETGKMHGYMRMYWGKKILEWSETPTKAYRTAIHLNNKYELDGRDPNGYAGVAWCFGKHDQGWKERPVYGKVRYMSASGLERKFDISKYVDDVEKITEENIRDR